MLSVQAIDRAGNASAVAQTSVLLDTTAPAFDALTSSSHANSVLWYKTAVVTVLMSNVVDQTALGEEGPGMVSGLDRYTWRLVDNGGAELQSGWASLSGGQYGRQAFQFNTQTLASGVYTVYVSVYDYAGNQREKSLTVKVDLDAPTLSSFSLSGISGGAWTTIKQPTLLWTAVDSHSGLASDIQVTLNQNQAYAMQASDPTVDVGANDGTYLWPQNIADGSYYLWMRVHDVAQDASGADPYNASAVLSYNLRIDSTAPVLAFGVVTATVDYALDQDADVEIVVSDLSALSVMVELVSGDSVLYSSTLASMAVTSNLRWQWDGLLANGTYLEQGSYVLRVTAVDELGHASQVTRNLGVNLNRSFATGLSAWPAMVYKSGSRLYIEYQQGASVYQSYSDDGVHWSAASGVGGFSSAATISWQTQSDSVSYSFFYRNNYEVVMRKSNDGGTNWSDEIQLFNGANDPQIYAYTYTLASPPGMGVYLGQDHFVFLGSVTLQDAAYVLIGTFRSQGGYVSSVQCQQLKILRIPAHYLQKDNQTFTTAMPYLKQRGLQATFRHGYDDRKRIHELEDTIDFNWGTGPVAPKGRGYDLTFQEDNDWVEQFYEGYIYIDRNASYEFSGTVDDRIEVYVDDQLCIDVNGVYNGSFGTCSLEQGFHRIKVAVTEDAGLAYVTLRMQAENGQQKILSKEILYSENFPRSGWNSRFQNDTRTHEPEINYDWGTGQISPKQTGVGVGSDWVNVSWNAYLVLSQSGTYRLTYAIDDVAKVYIDGVLRLEVNGHTNRGWYDTASFSLDAGTHDVRVTYEEHHSDAYCQIRLCSTSWSFDDYFIYNIFYDVPTVAQAGARLTPLALVPLVASANTPDLLSPLFETLGDGRVAFAWQHSASLNAQLRFRLQIADAQSGTFDFSRTDYQFDFDNLTIQTIGATANRYVYTLADYQALPQGVWAWRLGVDNAPTDSVDTFTYSAEVTFNIAAVPGEVLSVINYPNPFIGETRIRYKLTRDAAQVKVKIYNAAGRLVRTLDGEVEGASLLTEYHDVLWDGRNGQGEIVLNGVYPYEVAATFADGSVKKARGKAIKIR